MLRDCRDIGAVIWLHRRSSTRCTIVLHLHVTASSHDNRPDFNLPSFSGLHKLLALKARLNKRSREKTCPDALGACRDAVDDSFGPGVVGCRQQLDLTLFFEGVFLAICPSIIFQICSAFRMTCLLGQSPEARAGRLWLLKIGMCSTYWGSDVHARRMDILP